MRNLSLYVKTVNMIKSCVIDKQLETCYNYIEQIRLTDENLANALMYEYELKIEVINNLK